MENIWQTVKDIAAILGDIGSALVGISTVILIFIHRPSRHGEGLFCYLVLFLRGLPPPTPRPGRCAFHWSMVSGSHPRVRPIVASGSGSL